MDSDILVWVRWGADCAMTTLIWLVQLVIYPVFAEIDPTRFRDWHHRYMCHISFIVMPLMIIQAGCILIQGMAMRAYGRFTPSDTPYSGLSSLGRGSDLRGYTSGENVAENLAAIQAEYRWMFTRRLGAVGFLGLSELWDGSVKNINSDTFYPSAGIGVRIMLNTENKMNFRVDYAWGSDDEAGLYVSVGEAF